VPSLERTPGPVLLLPVPQTELHDVITYTWVVAAVAYLTRAMHDSLKKKNKSHAGREAQGGQKIGGHGFSRETSESKGVDEDDGRPNMRQHFKMLKL